MSDAYDPIQLTNDAVEFAQSRFGKHYLARLQKLHDDYLDNAKNLRLSDSERAHQTTLALALDKELDYFRTAQTVIKDKKLLDKLRNGIQRRRVKEERP